VPAGESFTIRFDNKDSDRHNVAILPSHTATTTLFEGDILPGPKSLTYNVPALKAGTYHFHCEVHPNLMNGVFIVGSAAAPAPAPTPPGTTSMGDAKPAPAPKTAEAAPAMPAPMPAASAPKPDAAAMPSRTAAGPNAAAPNAGAPKTAAPKTAGTNLPRTGPHSARLLLILAGTALAAGGLSVLGGARRAAFRA
jgi:hypothetical protein